MDVAVVDFAVTYDHNKLNLMVYVDKMVLRQRAIEAYPHLVRNRLRLHASLFPLRYRAKTRSQKMTGVYFVYNQVLAFSPARAPDIGSMWLRLRIYTRCKFRSSQKIAEGHMLLTDVPLTHKTTPFMLTLKDNPDLTAFFSAQQFKQRGSNMVCPTVTDEQKELDRCPGKPRLAMQLNYDKQLHHFIVHLQRAEFLNRYGPFAAFAVSLCRPNLHEKSNQEVMHRLTTEVLPTETTTLIHIAFELPASPALCRVCHIVVNVYSGAEKRLVLSKMRSARSVHEGSVTFGANVDGTFEKEQYFAAFVDADPTELAWYDIEEKSGSRRFYVNSGFS